MAENQETAYAGISLTKLPWKRLCRVHRDLRPSGAIRRCVCRRHAMDDRWALKQQIETSFLRLSCLYQHCCRNIIAIMAVPKWKGRGVPWRHFQKKPGSPPGR